MARGLRECPGGLRQASWTDQVCQPGQSRSEVIPVSAEVGEGCFLTAALKPFPLNFHFIAPVPLVAGGGVSKEVRLTLPAVIIMPFPWLRLSGHFPPLVLSLSVFIHCTDTYQAPAGCYGG